MILPSLKKLVNHLMEVNQCHDYSLYQTHPEPHPLGIRTHIQMTMTLFHLCKHNQTLSNNDSPDLPILSAIQYTSDDDNNNSEENELFIPRKSNASCSQDPYANMEDDSDDDSPEIPWHKGFIIFWEDVPEHIMETWYSGDNILRVLEWDDIPWLTQAQLTRYVDAQ